MKLDVWGVEASPYLLKIEALLNYRGADFRRLPRDGGRWLNLLTSLRLNRARRSGRVQRYPRMDPLDEYPSVPYLFSVAPQGYRATVESQRIPPSRPGFPPTHELLEQSWSRYLAAVENLLSEQAYLLGEQFTVADASTYGQLSMNLIDPTTAAKLRQQAPVTYRWLLDIRHGKHRGSTGELVLSSALGPLLDIISQTFVPLMLQNERAYQRALEAGENLFNEAAFDQDRALYDGELLGYPFRAVAKTFQVRVWRDLCSHWGQLNETGKATLRTILPAAPAFDGD